MKRLCAVVAIAGLAGCHKSTQPEIITDSVGVDFHWFRDGVYDPGPTDDAPEPRDCGELESGWSYAWGRFFSLCTVCFFEDGGWGSETLGDCRVIVCQDDGDCPIVEGYDPVCQNGICQNVEHAANEFVDNALAIELCAHDFTRDEVYRSPAYDTYFARMLQVECDPDTRSCWLPLPEGCLQP